jgi:hypothetical protein
MPDVIQQQNIAVDSTVSNSNITKSSTLEQEVYNKLALLYKELTSLL